MPQHVLVISDQLCLRNRFIALLRNAGYGATALSYPDSPLAVIEALVPQLIIVDLPTCNEKQGWNLLTKLRLHWPTASIPALVFVDHPTLSMLRDPYLRRQHITLLPTTAPRDDLLPTVALALL